MDPEIINEKCEQYKDGEGRLNKQNTYYVLLDVFEGHETIAPTILEVQLFWQTKGLSDEDTVCAEEIKELVDDIDSSEREGKLRTALEEAFKVYDKDGNDLIDKEELEALLRDTNAVGGFDVDLDDKFIESTISLVDKDGDGKLSIKELVDMLMVSGHQAMTL